MQKAHDAQYNNYWQNLPSVDTPIVAAQLNRNEQTVNTIDDRVVSMDTTKANETDMLLAVKTITYDGTTGTFTITFFNGTTQTIDTDIEKIAVNFSYDDDPTSPYYQHIIIELEDGTYKYIDLSALITEYEFANTSTIQITVNSGVVSADVIDGSITASKLTPNYLADVTAQANAANNSATAAGTSKLDAEAWAVGKRNGVDVPNTDPTYHNNAYYWSQQANVTSLTALTDTDINSPQDGQALIYDANSSKFINQLIALSDLGTVNITSPTVGDILKYDGAEWKNTPESQGILPRINVTVTSGATVTATKGGETINGVMVSATSWYVDVTDYGTWTVTAVNGGTNTGTVTVDTVKEYSIDLSNSVPEGSTVTPTDDIQTWLACAGITDKAYTTIGEVLADSVTLSALMADNNASDYLVRSTTWASDVCADSGAMTDIGSNNYTANLLLTDNTWCTAICNSTYFESVLNVKVPTMTSATTPSGEVSASSFYPLSYHEPYNAFNSSTYGWSSADSDSTPWIEYEFVQAGSVAKIFYHRQYSGIATDVWTLKASNDGITYVDIEANMTLAPDSDVYRNVSFNPTRYKYWRMNFDSTSVAFNSGSGVKLQFYGRTDV